VTSVVIGVAGLSLELAMGPSTTVLPACLASGASAAAAGAVGRVGGLLELCLD
jgi:hypothetical protein